MNATKQAFDYYVVLDFEATCDQGPAPDPQEIIEYPSLLLDGANMEPVDEFQSFVRPRHNPVLTGFCTELTGITQEQVNRAPLFREVFDAHLDWLVRHGLDVSCEGNRSSFAFVLCGDWDFRSMLPRQFAACDPPMGFVPRAFRQWINVKFPFADYMHLRKSPGLAGMLRKLGLEFQGRPHRGIDDCRNIARVARRMARDGVLLDVTTNLPVSGYPPIPLILRYGEHRQCVVLKRRSLKSLFKLAGTRFNARITSIREPGGRELNRDDQLLELHNDAELTVAQAQDT